MLTDLHDVVRRKNKDAEIEPADLRNEIVNHRTRGLEEVMIPTGDFDLAFKVLQDRLSDAATLR